MRKIVTWMLLVAFVPSAAFPKNVQTLNPHEKAALERVLESFQRAQTYGKLQGAFSGMLKPSDLNFYAEKIRGHENDALPKVTLQGDGVRLLER